MSKNIVSNVEEKFAQRAKIGNKSHFAGIAKSCNKSF